MIRGSDRDATRADRPFAGRVNWRARLTAALLSGLASFVLVLVFRQVAGQKTSDFDQLVVGMRQVLNGSTPYTLTPLPGLEWPVYYPLPALLVALPLVGLPLELGQAVFCGISGALCGWALSKDGGAKLFAFATWSYVLTVSLGQWGLWLLATASLPALGWIAIAKPNIGLALAAGYAPLWIRGRAKIVNAAAIGLLLVGSMALRPTWIGEWRAVLETPTPQLVTPIRILGGQLLLLGFLRWRLPEGRFLATLACVPQTLSSYDSLLLFLVVRTRKEALLLVACSLIVTLYVARVGPAPTYAETVHRFAPARILLLYLPALALVLRRPNVGDAPAWLEHVTSRFPAWLAGRREPQPRTAD